VAASELNLASPSRFALAGTPVLMYHALTTGSEGAGDVPYDARYSVAADAFTRHVGAIAAAGCRVIDLAAFGRGDAGRAAVVTFDDGMVSDHALAFPRLLEAGVSATFFVNSATVDRPGYLTWAHMREMQGRGMSFQSHGHDHVYLSRLGADALDRQLRHSKERIEDGVGAPVEFLAVPFGDCSARVIDGARAVGYRAVCTSLAWPARPGARTISRIAIAADTSRAEVDAILAGAPGPFLRRGLRAMLVYGPKQARLALRARRGAVPAVTVHA
jgi:peptidoglycan/xylan/chitin deacetylase (PgdA/CDA1 family)